MSISNWFGYNPCFGTYDPVQDTLSLGSCFGSPALAIGSLALLKKASQEMSQGNGIKSFGYGLASAMAGYAAYQAGSHCYDFAAELYSAAELCADKITSLTYAFIAL